MSNYTIKALKQREDDILPAAALTSYNFQLLFSLISISVSICNLHVRKKSNGNTEFNIYAFITV